jgi:Uma2 family endonuclease
MLPLLEEPSIRHRAHPLSVEAYHALGVMGALSEQVELLNGVIIEKMPRSPLHIWLVEELAERLLAVLMAGFFLRKECPLTTTHSEPEPDLAVVSGNRADYLSGHPRTAELVIEVSISTEETDRAKADIYAGAGVKEYWIVLPQQRRIEVFQNPAGAAYLKHTVFEDGVSVTCGVLPGFTVDLAALLARAKV